jgi:hypothetical protein
LQWEVLLGRGQSLRLKSHLRKVANLEWKVKRQMAFVRLNRSGQSVWINSDRIAYFEPVESLAQDGSKRAETRVCFDSDLSIVVDEPIEQLRHRFQ